MKYLIIINLYHVINPKVSFLTGLHYSIIIIFLAACIILWYIIQTPGNHFDIVPVLWKSPLKIEKTYLIVNTSMCNAFHKSL